MDFPPPSRRASIASHAHSMSAVSLTGSTRHILADMPLEPPFCPPSPSPIGSQSSFLRHGETLPKSLKDGLSLSVNYLPTKFSNPSLLSPSVRKRKGGKGPIPIVPKLGGGVEAFKSGEARMPGQNDEDYDGITGGWFGGRTGGHTKPKLRWNKFKWILFFANLTLTIYSLIGLIFCLVTWFDVWKHADIVRVANRPELILSTLASSLGVVTSLVGWAGILLNNRSFLAVYTFMLWLCFAALVAPGYITYRRRIYNLEGKINAQWSRAFGSEGRLRIQNHLGCCGYFSPFIEATVSQTCFARSTLPGCKLGFLKFERLVLGRWYVVAFALVPLQIGVIFAGLLCSNHVTYRFGKGMMPKAYRLSANSMAVIMDNYASQLAEQYGADVATEALARSRSNLLLQAMPTMPYNEGAKVDHGHHKYDSLGTSS